MQVEVEKLLITLGNLQDDVRLRGDLGANSEYYYWENCRDIVVRIKNQVAKLKEWVHP